MNKDWKYLKDNIEKFPEYKEGIFEQGYCITNHRMDFNDSFPYYGNWTEKGISENVFMYVHKNQKDYILEQDGYVYFMLGHAYDPFSMIADENEILKRIADASKGVFLDGLDIINDLTGLFVFGIIDKDNFTICGDFESMRATYYGKVSDRWYIASHEEIIALNEKLTSDEYIERLEKYRWYHLYGEGLPGDDCHYKELKKLMCNTYVEYIDGEFYLERLYPLKPLDVCKNEEEYTETVEEIAEIMKRSLDLTYQKWDRVAVSTTGGRDSKGSLAAAYHLGNKIEYFSYNSQPAEKVDCEAAERICNAIGVNHVTYDIPLDKELYPEYDVAKAIHSVNSNRKYFNHNDIMKRIYFRRLKPFDVEVKSWTSEIGRCFFYRKYGVKKLQKKANGRLINVMNNIYLLNPKLMYETDARYRDYYIKRTKYNEHMFNYDWTNLVEMESRDSRWGADVVSCEHMFCYDLTVPYNNRHLGDLLQKPQFEKRLSSQTHIDFTNMLCPYIGEIDINVKDLAHDKKRMWLDRIYYFISSCRPL